MNSNQNLSYFKCPFSFFIFIFITINSQINDNYELQSLDGNSLIDVFDYHNLKLVVSTSGNIYEGIPQQKNLKPVLNYWNIVLLHL